MFGGIRGKGEAILILQPMVDDHQHQSTSACISGHRKIFGNVKSHFIRITVRRNNRAEEVLYDICSMRAFAGLELGRDAIPDETTILNFQHLLERHGLTKAVFAAVSELLEARGALLRGGTIVDATLIAASPSTKNGAQKRDPEMRSSKKGNQWYFGMKAHIGVDVKSGLVHTAGVTTGSVHDAKVMDNLIREDDRAGLCQRPEATAGGSRGRSVGRKGESEARAPTVDIATPTQPSVLKNPCRGRVAGGIGTRAASGYTHAFLRLCRKFGRIELGHVRLRRRVGGGLITLLAFEGRQRAELISRGMSA